MAGIGRRLERLESRLEVSSDEAKSAAHREFLRRLTPEELGWLCEPGDRAEALVPCPHVELVECGCRSAERQQRGFEAHPNLREEYLSRWRALLERTEEIVRRDPEEMEAGRRGRRGLGA